MSNYRYMKDPLEGLDNTVKDPEKKEREVQALLEFILEGVKAIKNKRDKSYSITYNKPKKTTAEY